jgi:hypothetical protein
LWRTYDHDQVRVPNNGPPRKQAAARLPTPRKGTSIHRRGCTFPTGPCNAGIYIGPNLRPWAPRTDTCPSPTGQALHCRTKRRTCCAPRETLESKAKQSSALVRKRPCMAHQPYACNPATGRDLRDLMGVECSAGVPSPNQS